jgi:NAD-dependent dihydropyrimidine dehydrogenase PreA subunit
MARLDYNDQAMPSVYVITDPCIDVKDKSCIEVCPVDCIHTDDDEDRVCYIDPDECIGCNLCLPACPVGAIFTAESVPSAAAPWVSINAEWFRDRDAARARVNELAT